MAKHPEAPVNRLTAERVVDMAGIALRGESDTRIRSALYFTNRGELQLATYVFPWWWVTDALV